MKSEAAVVEVAGPQGARQVRLTSPDRVLWPEPGFTKLDLATYCVAVGDAFVAQNGDRPVSLQRFPADRSEERRVGKECPV